MKLRILCTFLFLLISHMAFGQEGDIDKVADEIMQEELKPSMSRDRLVFEVNHDNWNGRPDGIKVRWYNRGFNGYVMYDKPLFKSKNISIAPGVGISTNNIYFNGLVSTDSSGNTTMIPIGDGVAFKKNKLSTTYLEVPVELRFRTTPDKFNRSFKVAIGARVGYRLDAKVKYKGEDFTNSTSQEIFFKDKNLPNINQFRYGGTVRIGYSYFNLVGYYSLATLFENNKGPGINPFSIGISFNMW